MFHSVDDDFYTEPFEANSVGDIVDKYESILKDNPNSNLKRFHVQVYKMIDVKL